MISNSLKSLVATLSLALPLACAQSNFSGEATSKKEAAKRDGKDANDGDPSTDDKGKDGGGKDDGGKDSQTGEDSLGNHSVDENGDGTKDGDLDESDETILKPQQCSTANIKYAQNGTENCPEDFAAYAVDDDKHPRLACCPLPVRDILLKNTVGTPRGTCGPDQIGTGVANGVLVCSKINTAKYKLGQAAVNCYVGHGASGSSGAGPCGAPNVTLQAMVSVFGTDACLGQPFGALITSWTGKNCGDTTSRQLFYAKDNQPVPMNLP